VQSRSLRLLALRRVLPALFLANTVGAAPAPERFARECVVSDSLLASQVGASILARGGNAVDGAVATAFALAVTHPAAGNVGGGGFLVVRMSDGRATTFDFREKAPLASVPEMFSKPDGSYDPDRHHWSILSVGVPGSVAGLHLAHSRLGKLPWAELVQPAVDLAAKGFPVTQGLAQSIREVLPSLHKQAAAEAQFTRSGIPLEAGDTLVQKDLARTLERIRDQGPRGFYEGETADLLVREMEAHGGLIRHDDLRKYRAKEREPVRGTYRDVQIISMPPPSSGGTAIIEMLNLLEAYDVRSMGVRSAAEVHLLAECMRRAFADRALLLGDPDFAPIPVDRLTSKSRAAELRRSISLSKASHSSPERFEWPAEGTETTHISVVDRDLACVSLTTTIEQSYGSRIVVTGAGFLLNNEMGDFNPRAGMTTRGGLVGTPPNLVAPEKRMLSSMSPSILERGGKPILVVGSPGGRTIINTVLEVIVNCIDHGLDVQAAVSAPRFHHQWLPDRIVAEAACLSEGVRKTLEALGHEVQVSSEPQGSAMAISILPGKGLEAGVDRRRPDTGAAGR
jgi:gamma-glutamyltranspeptidase/glutathione hydrolase